jgi:hypothetical protein
MGEQFKCLIKERVNTTDVPEQKSEKNMQIYEVRC